MSIMEVKDFKRNKELQPKKKGDSKNQNKKALIEGKVDTTK